MSVHNVDLIRAYVLRKLKDLRIYVSCLSPTETDALLRMDGARGQQVAARIADFVLSELSHQPPKISANGDSPTVREARRIVGKGA